MTGFDCSATDRRQLGLIVTYIDPADGLNTIDTQMVSLDMRGFSHFAGELKIHLAVRHERRTDVS